MENEPKLIFTEKLPDKEGFYYFTNFGEHTPCILEVIYIGDELWAQGEEFTFEIKNLDSQLELTLKEHDPDEWYENDDGKEYKYGDELWCYIPNPWLPSGKKQLKSDCY